MLHPTLAMISIDRLTRIVFAATLLGGLASTGFSQAQSLNGSDLGRERLAEAIKWEENVRLELRALGEVGGVPVALVDVNGEPTLVCKQSGLLSLRVETMDLTAKRISFTTRMGKKRVLGLEQPDDFAFPEVDPERFFTAEAIAKRRDPRGFSPPQELVRSWPGLGREAKIAILADALKQGTLLQMHVERSGGISTTSGFLFAELQATKNRERKDRFLATLTPVQRAEFDASAAPAIRFTASSEEIAAQKTVGKESAARRGEFLASLSPVQRARYDEWMDSI